MNEELSRLEVVELRDVWPDEAQDFTPWLAKNDNISLLGETLGIELAPERKEIGVGDFKADILCKNEDDSWVVIENQLEKTDRDHLGKILTYSAGLNAKTVIWIAKEFRDEHRAALDQLNEITNDEYSFFGVEIKLWKIANSSPAPRFEIVIKPNNWNPTHISTTDWKTKFWTKLNEYFRQTNLNYNIRIPGSKNTVEFGIGNPDEFSLQAVISQQKKRIGIRLALRGGFSKAYFNLLNEQQENIEKEFGEKLEWEELPHRKTSIVALYKNDTDPQVENEWENQTNWIASILTNFDKVFRERLLKLDPTDWVEPEAEENEEDYISNQ